MIPLYKASTDSGSASQDILCIFWYIVPLIQTKQKFTGEIKQPQTMK